jgi:sodium transport system ATP-binding protein
MIVFEEVRKSYGSTVAVDGVSFVAPDGVVTGLLGPNGAGKTTTLRILTGLVKPDAGSAVVDGLAVHSDPRASRRRLGMLPETVGLYDRLTVREHLVYGGELQGLTNPYLRQRVEDLLSQLALGRLATRPTGQLSLGERRRVALARALVHEPPNVVLDEPTSGLDVPTAREVRREVRRLAAGGCAVVLSTHVMQEVSAVCDQIVILSRGRLVAAGTPDEIQTRAQVRGLEDAFVKLIGSEEGLN